VHSDRRLTRPRRRDGDSAVELDWTGLPDELRGQLREAGRLAAVVSPFLSVEEAYLLCKLIRQLDPEAVLVLGPVPTMGTDQRFPTGFTISAEKCPNRRGVEAILGHFAGLVRGLDDLLTELGQGEIRGVWVSGGYRDDWIDEATASRSESLDLLIVQDLFPSPLSERADYQLPGAAYAERDGSYVNRSNRLQTACWAVRPPAGVHSEGSLYWRMLEREGLFGARSVLDEVAREILAFSAAADPVPEVGVDLMVNLLAARQTDTDQPMA
jgi:NADH-quinone oxidoreductase subunit G